MGVVKYILSVLLLIVCRTEPPAIVIEIDDLHVWGVCGYACGLIEAVLF